MKASYIPEHTREARWAAPLAALTQAILVRPARKVHSHEDKSTLRICQKHYNEMPKHPREWDLWVAVAFPKWDRKVYHMDGEQFAVEAKWFINNERIANK